MAVKTKPKPLLIIIIIVALFLIIIGGSWLYLTGPVNRHDTKDIEVTIDSGTSTREIGSKLKEKKLIRSAFLFSVYTKFGKVSSLKAATYKFNRSMNLNEIIRTLEKGSTYNPNMVKLTFKEGERITDYAKTIANNTNHTEDEVITIMKDKEYISSLIANYWFLTDVILNESIYYPLEGYLAPDTYHFDDKDVEIKDIIEKMLKTMDKRISKYKEQMVNHDLHYYLTMASLVELEGTNTENRKMIVQVFENRIASGYNLGSDVTTYYGLQVPMNKDLTTEQFASVNGYNTRSNSMISKMPVGPICNVSESSIEASIFPTDNDDLFFVADKNGEIYFSKTMKEHERKIAEIKEKGNWIW